MMDIRDEGRARAAVPHGVLSAVSHELRGPLGVARGYLRLLLQRDDLDDRARKAASEAEHATVRIADLLDALADYTRLSRGDSRLALTPVAAGALLAEAAAGATPPRGVGVTMTVRSAPDLELRADGRRLRQALGALAAALVCAQVEAAEVVLAAEHDGRGVVIEVAVTPVGDAGTEVPALRTATGDTGRGEVPAVRTGPAEPEERAIDLGRPAPGHGAGLGLALADLIVRLHGGTVVERWPNAVWRGYRVILP